MNDKKNIVILMSNLNMGGAERVAVSYANWLINNTNRNVYIIKFDNEKPCYELDKKVNVINFYEKTSKNRIKNIIKRLMFCKKTLKKINANIIFAMFYQTQFYALISKPKKCLLIGSERCNINNRSIIGRFMSRYMAKKCNGYIFQTNGIKQMYPKNVVKKSVVIPNAISNNKVYDIKNVTKENIITAMGRLTEQKGFDTLIKAFNNVYKVHQEYKLIIYGEGTERNNLQTLINKLNLNGKVILAGTSAEAIKKVACSKIFVLSSRYEGMPNVLIEAMACGTACISTKCNFGPEELIENNYNGILVPVDDIKTLGEKINYLIENNKVREQIEKHAVEIKNRLDSSIIYKRYYDYFMEINNKKTKNSNTFFYKALDRILRSKLNKLLPDKLLIKLKYYIRLKNKLNLHTPQTFNEKLQWLKLYDRNPEYTKMVDKYEAKKYVANIIGEEYIIPTLAVYDKFDDIEWDKLPNQFVIKCTHDSGGLVICKEKEKLNIDEAKKKINKSLKRNYYYLGREWPYKNVKPRIIIEKYMGDDQQKELIDYKFMCFNGKVKCIFTCTDRFSKDGLKVTFFDTKWNKLPFERHYPSSKEKIVKPQCYKKMAESAEKLSKNIPFVRVDFYEIDMNPYFGELTFYPGSGMEEFTPNEYDKILGDMLELPKEKRE